MSFTYCIENDKICHSLIKLGTNIKRVLDQFPEAVCDLATALILKDISPQYPDRLTWRGGKVNSVLHFWIYDQLTKLNIDLTAYQFPHIMPKDCQITVENSKNLQTVQCPFLIATDDEIKQLGYKVYDEANWIALVHCPLPKAIFADALQEWDRLHRV